MSVAQSLLAAARSIASDTEKPLRLRIIAGHMLANNGETVPTAEDIHTAIGNVVEIATGRPSTLVYEGMNEEIQAMCETELFSLVGSNRYTMSTRASSFLRGYALAIGWHGLAL